MVRKSVVPRERARLDVEQALVWYLDETGLEAALGFVDALEQTYSSIGEHPNIGSPRYGQELDLPHLRHRKLQGFPWLVFYLEPEDHIDVWRVLDARRDIPAWLVPSD